MRVVGMLRVKNEARWIDRCIASIQPFCDQVLVMDDHSTDDTLARCSAIPGVTAFVSPFHDLNESRDKNMLLELAEKSGPDWIIAIDGDEMLSESAREALPAWLSSRATALSLRIWYLWDREDQKRVDGVYGDFHRESVFRPNGSRFVSTSNGGNFHCGNVPWAIRQRRQVIDLPILHFGYMHRADRERKFAWYNERDPRNMAEDEYKHMVIGDIFPATSRFMHGGPLRLESLGVLVRA